MLSSSPFPTALGPIALAGDTSGNARGALSLTAFADLLSGASPSADTDGGTAAAPQEPPVTIELSPAQAAVAVRALITRPRGAATSGAANGEPAATPTGKNLPVALPDADETAETESAAEKPGTQADAPEDAAAVAGNAPLVPLPLPVFTAGHAAAAPRSALPARAGDSTLPAAPTTPAAIADKAPAATKEGPQAPSSTPVAITVRIDPAATPAEDAGAGDAALRAPSKGLRIAEAARPEAPAGLPPAATTPVAQHEPAPVQAAPTMAAAPAPAPVPAPADIAAALDHLAAAREAAMPAEAALAIDHAEFGEVSIRFEQSREGRLSVELTAADPDLQRAVTAAVAADRSLPAGADGDAGRAAGQPGQRGSAAGNDAAPGDGTPSRHDRETSSRRGPMRHQAAAGSADTSSGVFA